MRNVKKLGQPYISSKKVVSKNQLWLTYSSMEAMLMTSDQTCEGHAVSFLLCPHHQKVWM